jgi:pyrimidine-nucleoside phosphorylase
MLVLGGRAKDEREARAKLQAAIADGSAERKLCELVQAQGGDPEAITHLTRLPHATAVAPVAAPASGFVQFIDSEAIGLAAMALGAGRERTDSVIDPAVGFLLEKKVGDAVQVGEPLVTVHYNDASKLEAVKARVVAAYRIGADRPQPRPLVLERIG